MHHVYKTFLKDVYKNDNDNNNNDNDNNINNNNKSEFGMPLYCSIPLSLYTEIFQKLQHSGIPHCSSVSAVWSQKGFGGLDNGVIVRLHIRIILIDYSNT